MFGRWLTSRMATRLGRLPAGQALYAVGDVHGRLDLLDALLERIRADADRHPSDEVRELVMLGDYIDRGPDSRGVVDRLIDGPPPGFRQVCLMGNHEDALLAFLDGHREGLDWLSYGGLETLLSYGVPLRRMPNSPEAVAELRQDLARTLPKSHEEFFRGGSHLYEAGDYVFVHAGVRPGTPLDRQSAGDLMWIRDDFLRSRSPLPGHIVVHGHTIVDLPQDLHHRINVDTGAFISGRLTCLVLRGQDRRFISTLDG